MKTSSVELAAWLTIFSAMHARSSKLRCLLTQATCPLTLPIFSPCLPLPKFHLQPMRSDPSEARDAVWLTDSSLLADKPEELRQRGPSKLLYLQSRADSNCKAQQGLNLTAVEDSSKQEPAKQKITLQFRETECTRLVEAATPNLQKEL
jgi:hypothetical protein